MLSHADLAEIAARAYHGPQSQTFPLHVSVDFDPRDNGSEIVVSLPGTDPTVAIDILRDITFWPEWFDGLGPLHMGFGQGAMEAWPYVDREMRHTGLATYTGHSLGASMAAILAAMHAIHRPHQPFRLVTFGQPRTAFCNPYFGHLLSKGVEKVIYARRGDPVPNVPTRPYLHGGRMTMIGTAIDDDPIGNHAVALYVSDLKALDI